MTKSRRITDFCQEYGKVILRSEKKVNKKLLCRKIYKAKKMKPNGVSLLKTHKPNYSY